MMDDERIVDFPTLGFFVADWMAAHLTYGDGTPLILDDASLRSLVKRSAVLAQQVAGDVQAEAAKGAPVFFAGFAEGGERYVCSDHGCGCGWLYEYSYGEPTGKPAAWLSPSAGFMQAHVKPV